MGPVKCGTRILRRVFPAELIAASVPVEGSAHHSHAPSQQIPPRRRQEEETTLSGDQPVASEDWTNMEDETDGLESRARLEIFGRAAFLL